MTNDQRIDTILTQLNEFRHRGRQAVDKDFENRLAFDAVNNTFVEQAINSDLPEAYCLC